jgi:hypothetical protein
MQSSVKARIMIVLFVFALGVSLATTAHAACSVASVAGSYGYTTNGFVATPSGAFVPVAAAGRIVFDGQGNVSGTQTRVLAGSPLDETYSGTYKVNGDCTGSFTVVVSPDTRTSTVNLVWSDNTNAANAVFTNPGFILTAVARRIHPRN